MLLYEPGFFRRVDFFTREVLILRFVESTRRVEVFGVAVEDLSKQVQLCLANIGPLGALSRMKGSGAYCMCSLLTILICYCLFSRFTDRGVSDSPLLFTREVKETLLKRSCKHEYAHW